MSRDPIHTEYDAFLARTEIELRRLDRTRDFAARVLTVCLVGSATVVGLICLRIAGVF